MVMESTNLIWLLNTIAHEWIHNYLTLRPLGLLYLETPELRTMNETTASIAGDEIGALVLERYYPELADRSKPSHTNSFETEHQSGFHSIRPSPNPGLFAPAL